MSAGKPDASGGIPRLTGTDRGGKRNARKKIHNRVQNQDGQGIPEQKGKGAKAIKIRLCLRKQDKRLHICYVPFFRCVLDKGYTLERIRCGLSFHS